MPIEGLIRPPPEIRAVANRTALYVAKNGPAFASKIMASSKGQTPKFAFLRVESPFHAYYQDRVEHYIKNGGKEDDNEEEKEQTPKESNASEKKDPSQQQQQEDASSKATTRRQASVTDPVAEALLEQRNRLAKYGKRNGDDDNKMEGEEPPPPPPLHFVNILPPASLSTLQKETIQIVAQFTAILDTDKNNKVFLSHLSNREWHNTTTFGFLQPRHAHFPYFSALVDAYRRILHGPTQQQQSSATTATCLVQTAYRAEHARYQQRKEAEEQNEAVTIDWYDFVVVETIDFPVNETVQPLPAPEPVLPEAPPQQQEQEEEEEIITTEEQETIRVVPTYQPKISTRAAVQEMVLDPLTGQSVPIADLPEHVRIQLLDPKWAAERKKYQDKQRESNHVDGQAVADNLARLAGNSGNNKDDVLENAAATKRRLADGSAALDQALQINVAPKRPGMQLPTPDTNKRPRLDVDGDSAPPPPPPPPPAPPVPDDPFAMAASGTAVTTMETKTPELMPAEEFAATLSKPEVTLNIRIPNDVGQMAWNFYGQIVAVEIDVSSTTKQVKQQLSKQHLNDMPVNKMQLKTEQGGFLKESQSLAAQNVGPTAKLELVPRARGRRK